MIYLSKLNYFFSKHIIIYCLFVVVCCQTKAQESGWSIEIKQMYNHANDYMQMGNIADAIIIYNQALKLEPDNPILGAKLGEAYYKANNYKEAIKILQPLVLQPTAQPIDFVCLSSSQLAIGKCKKSIATIQRGLHQFPDSGILYHQYGLIYEIAQKYSRAIWVYKNGIVANPAYTNNYYQATLAYCKTYKYIDAILCGETYLNLEMKDTTKQSEIKKWVFESYKNLFMDIAIQANESRRSKKKQIQIPNFIKNEQTITAIYTQLTPVVSDGITTENLTMLRTRFLMDWFKKGEKRDTVSLFLYQDKLLRAGWFDVYNQWLFGKTEDTLQFKALNNFHTGAIDSFLKWKTQNPYKL